MLSIQTLLKYQRAASVRLVPSVWTRYLSSTPVSFEDERRRFTNDRYSNRDRGSNYSRDNNRRDGNYNKKPSRGYGQNKGGRRFEKFNSNSRDYDNDKFQEIQFPPLPELEESQKIIKSTEVADSDLHPDIKKAFISQVGPTFTACQEKSINHFLHNPKGIIVRAKTGTGKTFAFGLPIFESLKEAAKTSKVLEGTNSIIFSPTRDLAVQMKNSLDKVWNKSNSRLVNNEISLVTGKIPLRSQLRPFRINFKPPIVVATPGRFIDLIENEPSFRKAMTHVDNIVIDEADELLNQNFKKDLETIFSILKDISVKEDEVKFKTFLFSATMSNNVYQLANDVIGEGYAFVDANEGAESEVNTNIKQSLVVTKSIFESYASALQFIRSHIHEATFKPMIFLPNTVSVDFFHELLNKYVKSQTHVAANRLPFVLKIHGKLTQGERNYAQRAFRGDPGGKGRPRQSHRPHRSAILVGSNVVSRGMDFPDVTHVIQIGVNADLSNYTHRVGRTGRAGKEGHSLLIATDYEIPFVKKLIEHGNSFEEELEYTPDATEEAAIRECARGMSYSNISAANLGIYTNLPARYGPIMKNDYLKGCSDLFRDLHEDPESAEKPELSRRAAQMMGLDMRVVRKYYNVESHRYNENEDDYEESNRRSDRFRSNRRY